MYTFSDMAMAVRGESGWQSDRTVVDCNRYMLENEIAADVCFVVGPTDGATVNIRAHKYMLISRSPVFEAMFTSGMAELGSGGETTIRIEDVNADIFKRLLCFIYYESAVVTYETAAPLLYAGRKYLLNTLVKECCECLGSNLNAENACHVLEQSLLYDMDGLRESCLRFIERSSDSVFRSEGFRQSSRRALQTILRSAKLRSRESVIFESCLELAKYQLKHQEESIEDPTDEQIRSLLGSLLYDIRFPVMEQKEFANLAGTRNVLSDAEKLSIYYFLSTKQKPDGLKFIAERRLMDEMSVQRALSAVAGPYGPGSVIDGVNVTVDEDILLTGLGLYTGYNGNQYDVEVEILQLTNSLLKEEFTIAYTGNDTPAKVSFSQPIEIRRGLTYSIATVVRDNKQLGYYSNSCQSVCKHGGVTFTFSRYAQSRSSTETHGQIPRLFFIPL